MKLTRCIAVLAIAVLVPVCTNARPQDPDSLAVAAICDSLLQAHFDSLARFLPDTNDIRKAIRKNRKEERDSIRANKPRILETFAVPDSLYYRRLLVWTADSRFNELHLEEPDTSYNYHFNDYPLFQKDVNATYLGPVGSATLYHNYFKRETEESAPMFTPYAGDSFTPDNLKQYNVKSPYTELAYWGTPFNTNKTEEAELNLLTTQNITPEFNFTLGYRRLGSRGMLANENTDHRNSVISGNYMGKRYMVHAGMIHQSVKRTENGGVRDTYWIRDTVIDTKAIEVNLAKADNTLKRTTFFINHNLAIPLNFFRKDRDSIAVGEGTMAFVGHYGEYTNYKKTYTDEIGLSDIFGRNLFNNKFYLNQTSSNTLLRIQKLDNRLFIKLQPFAPDAVVSKINAGVGYRIMWLENTNTYGEESLIDKGSQHDVYLYAGASGMLKKYFKWNADGEYYLAGHRMLDFSLNGNVTFSAYPLDEGIHLTGRFHMSRTTPHAFEQRILTNHHIWNNEFSRVTTTRFEGLFSIPKWKLEAFAGYAILGDMLYYDNLATIRQSGSLVNVFSAYLRKDFKLWAFHLDHKVLFQKSSNPDILPLPEWSMNLRYYVQFPVVRNVMEMQIGLNGIFHTSYYAPAYDPDLGQFHTQKEEKIGGVPYFDAFVNVQWKRACLFVKLTNCFKDWPASDYFSAYRYVRPVRGFKFGIFWPLYFR